ncbi:hypothetical protein BDS110ZK25_84310 [Bradyrhizobium diazoefficiens]|uniref:Uncharacterized protein n=1 Tax=Bradyrhizobium diazoefficiens SEMIA 5080 TaxID=754504 RepID=A0A837CQ61_9BRAD|nr:hypothetical protein BJA5080_08051 [Bradyrhizobium diazoefficiens SEMIA 5080]GEC50954.1 hypothetical protein BJA01nite_85960 [Bradyrhizobium japonicum]
MWEFSVSVAAERLHYLGYEPMTDKVSVRQSRARPRIAQRRHEWYIAERDLNRNTKSQIKFCYKLYSYGFALYRPSSTR